jgi:proto-oncogene tyrosine-protein kinase ROS
VLVGSSGLETVKLSDVGLSRTLATSDYYRKTSSAKVPVKWMAPESIVDRMYTSASDVWSFGVLCWEVFSFGETPYSKWSIYDLVCDLVRGKRLEQPSSCPPEMYVVRETSKYISSHLVSFDVISQCWSLDPKDRPTFRRIKVQLEDFSEAGMRL